MKRTFFKMSVSFGTLQNVNFVPLYKPSQGPSMYELYYLLKTLYNYEPGIINIIKQFIFTKSSPLNKENISIWEVYAFYFNYQLTEREYMILCNDNTIVRFWSEYRTITVINRHAGTLIQTWQITYKDINLVYDYCRQYYLANHNSSINNYKTLIRLHLSKYETKNKIIQQEYLIKKQELDFQLIDNSITKDGYYKLLTKLIFKKQYYSDKFIDINQKECYNKCENIRAKILTVLKRYNRLNTHILCLK